jgi:hypothetical protein
MTSQPSDVVKAYSFHGDDAETITAAEAIALLSDAFRSHAQVSAPSEDKAAAALGVAWTIRVLRTAEAIVELHRQGDAASPLVRSVMEHAISMLWLVERRAEAVKAIEFGHRRHQRLLRDSASKGGWDLSQLNDEIGERPLDLAVEKPEDWPRRERFEQRMKDPAIRSWYPAYHVESSLSHASYFSGAVYVGDEGAFSWRSPLLLRRRSVRLRCLPSWQRRRSTNSSYLRLLWCERSIRPRRSSRQDPAR